MLKNPFAALLLPYLYGTTPITIIGAMLRLDGLIKGQLVCILGRIVRILEKPKLP